MINSLFFTLVLSLIFILHGLEEYVLFDESSASTYKFIGSAFYNRRVFGLAVTLLGLIVVGTGFFNFWFTSYLSHILVVIILFALFINGAMHCLGSLFYRKFIPGTLTACLFIIPFSIYIFMQDASDIAPSVLGFVEYGFVSLIVMMVAIFVCFWVSYLLLGSHQHFDANRK